MKNLLLGDVYNFCISLKESELSLEDSIKNIRNFIRVHLASIFENETPLTFHIFRHQILQLSMELFHNRLIYRECCICYEKFRHLYYVSQGNFVLCQRCLLQLSNNRSVFLNPITRQTTHHRDLRRIRYTWPILSQTQLSQFPYQTQSLLRERNLLTQLIRLFQKTTLTHSPYGANLLQEPSIPSLNQFNQSNQSNESIQSNVQNQQDYIPLPSISSNQSIATEIFTFENMSSFQGVTDGQEQLQDQIMQQQFL